MTITEILLFLIFTILVASHFRYFGVKGEKADTPEFTLIIWLILFPICGVLVWLLHWGINAI